MKNVGYGIAAGGTTGAAAFLAYHGIGGWGWFLLVAVIIAAAGNES